MKMRRIKRPELRFTEEPLRTLVKRFKNDGETVILADRHNYPKIEDLGKVILVRNNHSGQVERIKKEHKYSKVIAIGGCTALDVGRACATNKELIAIPSILSTACLSIDKAILYDGDIITVKTNTPNKVIVSFPILMDTTEHELWKWSASGFGDMFARLSASIEMAWKENRLSLVDVKAGARECFEAIDWILDSFEKFDLPALERLAKYLHEVSLIDIIGGASIAGEHELYYTMIKQQKTYTKNRPTHGQLVSAGTLLAVKALSEIAGDREIYEKLSEAYGKLVLPLSYTDLEDIGIERTHLIHGLNSISPDTFLGKSFAEKHSLLDDVFEKKKKPETAGINRAIEEIKSRHECSYEILADNICKQIKEYYERNGKPKLILGLSGGIDSTVVTYLAVRTIGAENVIPITMPSRNDEDCERLSELVREKLEIKENSIRYVVPIGRIVDTFMKEAADDTLDEMDKIDAGNYASRTRISIIYNRARRLSGRVLGTGNRTEFVQGYATKYGTPNSCDFGVLDELYKTDIYELAKVLDIPKEIIEQTPSTGFYSGQTHEDELGANLELQDAAAFLLFEKKLSTDEAARRYGIPRDFLELMKKRFENSEHKRRLQSEHVKLGDDGA